MIFVTSLKEIDTKPIPEELVSSVVKQLYIIENEYGRVEDGRDPYNNDGGICVIIEKDDSLISKISVNNPEDNIEMISYDDIGDLIDQSEFTDQVEGSNGWYKSLILCSNDYGITFYFYDPEFDISLL